MIRTSKTNLAKRTVALLLFVISGIACTPPDTPVAKGPIRSVKDDLGRSVEVPERVERVISLAPNLTEIIYAVGAGDKLAGVTTFCNYPPEALEVRRVSDTQKPNIESIIALKPDVVFVSTASQLEAFAQTLEDQKIAVFVTSPNSIDDIYRSIEVIGEILGRLDRARDLTDELRTRVAMSRGPMAEQNPPKVFVQIDKDSLYTVGKDSYITEIITAAGGISATAALRTAYPKISRESAIAMNPDAIVISESEGNREPNEAFRNSPAVRNGKVFKIDADLLSRPGPRFADALEQIAEKLRTEKRSGPE